jgi:hypothetical protein
MGDAGDTLSLAGQAELFVALAVAVGYGCRLI